MFDNLTAKLEGVFKKLKGHGKLTQQNIQPSGSPPVSFMLVGLHGCGKTTTAAKLARYFKERKKRPYLVPADVYRPAAIDQLQKLGEELKVAFYRPEASQTPLEICVKGREIGY